jgi:HEAT repeat protein
MTPPEDLLGLSDFTLQSEYLNSWDGSSLVLRLLVTLDDEAQVLRVIKLAMNVDVSLAIRMADEVKPIFLSSVIELFLGERIFDKIEKWISQFYQSDAPIVWWEDTSRSASQLFGILDNEFQALRIVKLFCGIDIFKAARLINSINPKFQRKAIEILVGKCKSNIILISLLGYTKSEQAIPFLLKLLDEESKNSGWEIADSLMKIGSEVVIPDFLELIHSKNLKMRYIAAYVLASFQVHESLPILIEAINENSGLVARERTIRALGNLKSRKAMDVLLKLFEEESDHMKSSIICSLGSLELEEVVPVLISYFEKCTDVDLKIDTLSALGNLSYPVVISTLLESFDDDSIDVRQAGIDTLRAMNSDSTVIALIEISEDEDSHLQANAAYALEYLNALDV